MWTDSCKSHTPPKFSYRSARKRREKKNLLIGQICIPDEGNQGWKL
jgi:hypothetical protein